MWLRNEKNLISSPYVRKIFVKNSSIHRLKFQSGYSLLLRVTFFLGWFEVLAAYLTGDVFPSLSCAKAVTIKHVHVVPDTGMVNEV